MGKRLTNSTWLNSSKNLRLGGIKMTTPLEDARKHITDEGKDVALGSQTEAAAAQRIHDELCALSPDDRRTILLEMTGPKGVTADDAKMSAIVLRPEESRTGESRTRDLYIAGISYEGEYHPFDGPIYLNPRCPKESPAPKQPK
jgi:hypothetical protein